jgi:catechol 2,3-dioxygenase-like lactoylglutathione lyase family enzyme
MAAIQSDDCGYAHRMALYHIRQIGLDVHELAAMIDFWSAALGYVLDHREAGYAVLRDPADAEPRLFLQQVPEPKAGKNRAHMDVEVLDERSAVDRLLQLGARVLWREDFRTHHWTVLADPEGNEFCVGHFG